MIEDINIEEWLRSRSVSVKENGAEVIFTHFTNEKSILIRRTPGVHVSYQPKSSPLEAFYGQFIAASIGDSMLMLAATIEGGASLSDGYSIPDFSKMKMMALELGIALEKEDEVFMVGSAGMFFYAYNPMSQIPKLRCYDRDYNTVDEEHTFSGVLDNWWQLLLDDSPK